jgi:hypothetical protein
MLLAEMLECKCVVYNSMYNTLNGKRLVGQVFLESDIPMINHVTLVVDWYYYPDLGEDHIR